MNQDYKKLREFILKNKKNKNVDKWEVIGKFEYNLFYDGNDLILAKYELMPTDSVNHFEPQDYFINAKILRL